MQLKDSSMIISALQSFISNKNQTLEEIVRGYPIFEYLDDGKKKTEITNKYFLMYGGHPTGMSKEEIVLERKWRKWVDDVYVHMLSPNVYRTMEESFQAFDWFSQVGNWEELFTTWERNLVIYVGSFAMYFIGKMLKKRHHLRDDVRVSFYEETNFWLKEVKKSGGKFLGGSEPNLGDLAMYGSLMAIEGCDAFQDLTRNTKIQAWFSLMKEAVNKHQGVKYLSERGPNRK
ncbi:UNVERIFIED_CONTAM: hypothetical protein GTU68_041166 [Idotea baltica]|nr:hypothetical protein [Idotea baltica]